MRNKKRVIWIGVYILIAVLFTSIHLSQGQASPGFFIFWKSIFQDEQQMTFLLYNRLPRFVIGCLAGSALAIAGMLMQTLTKNPLASASTLGIHAGTYFFIVAAAIAFPSVSSTGSLLVAFIGGLIAASIVWLLVGRALDPVRVALTGLIVGMLFSSFTSALQLFFSNEVAGLFLWGSGTLLQLDWSGVQFSWPWLLVATIIALLASQKFDVLLLGEETAIGLGEKVNTIKSIGWLVAIFLAATTVAVVGPIGFVGIISPHIVRLMGFTRHRQMIIGNILIGSMLLVGADILVRFISPTTEIPVGAMTAIIGGPWLIYLAVKMGKTRQAKGSSLNGHESFSRKWLVFSILLLFLTLIIVMSLLFGGTSFTPIQSLFSELSTNPYVWNFRVPRVLVSFMVGMLMAASGVMLQVVLRNPLADASVLGVTTGAGMMAMITLILLPGVSIFFLPFSAMIGAMITMLIILAVGAKSGFQPVMLVLIGVSISAVCSAIIQVIVVKSKLGVTGALTWLSGSTYGSSWDGVWIAGVIILVLFPIIYYFHKTFDVLLFGDELAIGFGLKVSKIRLYMIIIGVILSGASVALVGTIGFIGLLAPHAARHMVGTKHVFVFPISVLLGGILLVLADFLGRFLLAPNEIPAGLLVSLIGAPYVLYLLHKSGKVRMSGVR